MPIRQMRRDLLHPSVGFAELKSEQETNQFRILECTAHEGWRFFDSLDEPASGIVGKTHRCHVNRRNQIRVRVLSVGHGGLGS